MRRRAQRRLADADVLMSALMAMRGDGFVQRPPVNEVVWSVALDRTPVLIGPYLPDVLGPWFTDMPQVQPVFPYEMPFEHSDLRRGAAGRPNPVLELLPVPDAARYWLTAAGQPWLVQVQNDYLALNWRAGHSPEPYVGFADMRERFTSLMTEVGAGLSRRGAQLRPLRAEMTYINIIEPNDLWQGVGDLAQVLAISVPDSHNAERMALAFSRSLSIDDAWAGRVHISLDTGYDPMKDSPRVALTITARSAVLSEQSLSASLTFLEAAHAQIEQAFLGLITQAARKEWNL